MAHRFVFFGRCALGRGVLCIELGLPILTIVDIAEEIKIVVKEVY